MLWGSEGRVNSGVLSGSSAFRYGRSGRSSILCAYGFVVCGCAIRKSKFYMMA